LRPRFFDERLVVRDERRVAVEELALVAGLGGLEQVGVLVEVVPVGDVRVLLGHPRRTYQPMIPCCRSARVDRDLLVVMYVLARSAWPQFSTIASTVAGLEALPRDLLGAPCTSTVSRAGLEQLAITPALAS
jgi:hypothetical protein